MKPYSLVNNQPTQIFFYSCLPKITRNKFWLCVLICDSYDNKRAANEQGYTCVNDVKSTDTVFYRQRLGISSRCIFKFFPNHLRKIVSLSNVNIRRFHQCIITSTSVCTEYGAVVGPDNKYASQPLISDLYRSCLQFSA